MPFHIVVPVDGSAAAEHSAEWAWHFARRTGAVVSVCSVFDPMLSCVAAANGAMIDPQPMLEALEADAGGFCAAAVTRAAAQAVTATSAVLEGAPASAIDNFAHARRADIIVLGTHGRRGLALGLLGSVTNALVRSTDLAVIAVGPAAAVEQTGPVVVAVDDSASSAAAGEWGCKLAAVLAVPLHLVHVGAGAELAVPASMQEIAEAAKGRGVSCTSELANGDVVETLVAAAAMRGASMLATGTHGRTALGRLFLGSVAEGLMRDSPVPVLVVRRAA